MRFGTKGLAFPLFALALASCGGGVEEVVLKHFPIDSRDGVLTRSMVAFDPEITTDGGGSIRVNAVKTRTAKLFEVRGLAVENARLVYRARLRTADVKGRVYLEMWCRIPGKGEFYSRALDSALDGTNEWTTQETPFLLKAGQSPDLVKLNLVIEGSGSAWIDDVKLIASPLS